MRSVAYVIALWVLLSGWTADAQTPSDAAALQRALAEVSSQIDASRAESAKYASGSIKALIDARAAILEQTRAMLEQRARATTFGIALTYSVDGKAFAAPADAQAQLTAVETELAALRTRIRQEQTEAARYTGSRARATALATLATRRQTEAMLEQKRVALTFGLPLYAGDASPAARGAAARGRAAPTRAAARDAGFDIVSIDSKVTDANDTWMRYAWKLKVRNNGASRRVLTGTIEFQDQDGFLVDSARITPFIVDAGAEDTATGAALVRLPGARNVALTVAKVEAR